MIYVRILCVVATALIALHQAWRASVWKGVAEKIAAESKARDQAMMVEVSSALEAVNRNDVSGLVAALRRAREIFTR